MKALPKSLEKLKADHRVEKVFMEDNDDGAGHPNDYWVWLKTGWADLDFDRFEPSHSIHEWTAREVLQRMKSVRPCSCADCAPKLSTASPQPA